MECNGGNSDYFKTANGVELLKVIEYLKKNGVDFGAVMKKALAASKKAELVATSPKNGDSYYFTSP